MKMMFIVIVVTNRMRSTEYCCGGEIVVAHIAWCDCYRLRNVNNIIHFLYFAWRSKLFVIYEIGATPLFGIIWFLYIKKKEEDLCFFWGVPRSSCFFFNNSSLLSFLCGGLKKEGFKKEDFVQKKGARFFFFSVWVYCDEHWPRKRVTSEISRHESFQRKKKCFGSTQIIKITFWFTHFYLQIPEVSIGVILSNCPSEFFRLSIIFLFKKKTTAAIDYHLIGSDER